MHRCGLKQSKELVAVVNSRSSGLRQQIEKQLTLSLGDIPDFSITLCGNYTIANCGNYTITLCG